MSSLLGSLYPSSNALIEVRRSGRKRVKLNHKKNPLFSRPIKQKRKRLTDSKPSRNFDVKPQKTKLSPYENSRRLESFEHFQRSQVIENMKQAVKEQQRKLKRLFSIKLIQETDLTEEKSSVRIKKVEIMSNEKTQTSITQQKLNSEDYESEFEVKRDLMEIGTAEEIEYANSVEKDEGQDDILIMEESEFYLAELPRFKKQTSRLLSDNYENQQLLYTIEHILPSWHQQEIDLHGPLHFSSE